MVPPIYNPSTQAAILRGNYSQTEATVQYENTRWPEHQVAQVAIHPSLPLLQYRALIQTPY